MVAQLAMWRLVVDIALITAILVMTFRWMRTSRAQALLPRTLELEASLRALISEADGAGRHLNDQLLRREQNLEKLLQEVGEAEAQLRRAIQSGEERSKELMSAPARARDVVPAVAPVPTAPGGPGWAAEDDDDFVPQPPPAARVATPRHAAPRGASSARSDQEDAVVGSSTLEAGELPRSELRELQSAYASAESMLRRGTVLEEVSAETKLSADQVRLLSQMIEVERVEEERSSGRGAFSQRADSRLGVLGTIRKQGSRA